MHQIHTQSTLPQICGKTWNAAMVHDSRTWQQHQKLVKTHTKMEQFLNSTEINNLGLIGKNTID